MTASFIISLLTVISALLTAVQTNPTMSPEARTAALSSISTAITIAQEEIINLKAEEKSMVEEEIQKEEVAGASTEEVQDEGEVEVNAASVVDSIVGKGQSYQVLGTIEVTNNTGRRFVLSGSAADIADALGVSITSASIDGMPDDLQFLYLGPAPKHEQRDIESKGLEVSPEESATIQVRFIKQPGGVGSFSFNVGNTHKEVSVTAPEEE